MWIEAILSHDDLSSVVARILPLEFRLSEDEAGPEIRLSALGGVELIENQGLRIVCRAAIRWPVLGIDLPFTAESLTLLLTPSVVKTSGRDALAFRLQLSELDLSWLPAALDDTVRERINRELKDRQVHFTWNFSETLSHTFHLLNAVRPVDALELDVAWGQVRVTREALVMAVSFHGHVHREGEISVRSVALAPVRRAAPIAAPNGHARDVRVPLGIAVAGAAALASVAGYGLSRVTAGLFRYWRRRRAPARWLEPLHLRS
jgi:hypothetical protein